MMPSSGDAREEKTRKVEQLRMWLIEGRESDVEGKTGYERVLWNCVNRYYRVEGKGEGLTLFFAHANGFPKEVSITYAVHGVFRLMVHRLGNRR